MTVTDDACPRRTGTHLEKDLSGEYLFYDPSGDLLHVLNGTAREIYLLCDGKRTLRGIASELLARFEVDEETSRRDCAATVAALSEKGLLEI
jgi:hypothetical protein